MSAGRNSRPPAGFNPPCDPSHSRWFSPSWPPTPCRPAGPGRDRQLFLERADPSDTVQRLVLTPLHADRFLYRFEEKPAGAAAFVKRYQVGATKEGFAGPATSVPECIVSGGPGTMTVTY